MVIICKLNQFVAKAFLPIGIKQYTAVCTQGLHFDLHLNPHVLGITE